MEPENPNKPEVRGPSGVTVVEEGEPGFKENVKEEFDLLKKKFKKESVLQEIEELLLLDVDFRTSGKAASHQDGHCEEISQRTLGGGRHYGRAHIAIEENRPSNCGADAMPCTSEEL